MKEEMMQAVKKFNVLQCDGCRDLFWWNESTLPVTLVEIAIKKGWTVIPHKPMCQEHIMCPVCKGDR